MLGLASRLPCTIERGERNWIAGLRFAWRLLARSDASGVCRCPYWVDGFFASVRGYSTACARVLRMTSCRTSGCRWIFPVPGNPVSASRARRRWPYLLVQRRLGAVGQGLRLLVAQGEAGGSVSVKADPGNRYTASQLGGSMTACNPKRIQPLHHASLLDVQQRSCGGTPRQPLHGMLCHAGESQSDAGR